MLEHDLDFNEQHPDEYPITSGIIIGNQGHHPDDDEDEYTENDSLMFLAGALGNLNMQLIGFGVGSNTRIFVLREFAKEFCRLPDIKKQITKLQKSKHRKDLRRLQNSNAERYRDSA